MKKRTQIRPKKIPSKYFKVRTIVEYNRKPICTTDSEDDVFYKDNEEEWFPGKNKSSSDSNNYSSYT